jgi:hypothetical protein
MINMRAAGGVVHFQIKKGMCMSQFFRVCVLGAALTAAGCGAGTPELGPAKTTPEADQDAIRKGMQDSMNRNNASPGGQAPLTLPDGEKKAP